MRISYEDQEALRCAKTLLENPSLAAKITGLIGMPIEKALELLPDRWAEVVNGATRKSLETALQAALLTLDDTPQPNSWEFLHKLAVAATGAGGGAFGLAGLPVELPLSTTIMLRSIADIARSEGERLRTPGAKLACLEVFALGGRSKSDDASESAYFLMRGALAKSVSEAAGYITERVSGGGGRTSNRQVHHTVGYALRRERLPEGRRASGPRNRCCRRRGDQRPVHRPFPGDGTGSLHYPQAGTNL